MSIPGLYIDVANIKAGDRLRDHGNGNVFEVTHITKYARSASEGIHLVAVRTDLGQRFTYGRRYQGLTRVS